MPQSDGTSANKVMNVMKGITHNNLIDRAEVWLSNSGKCPYILTERGSDSEIADALGFGWNGTILMECKVTRPDFLVDKQKAARRVPEEGFGDYRYFVTPWKMISASDVPEPWGLIQTYGRGLRTIRKAKFVKDRNLYAYAKERRLLLAEVHRLGWRVSMLEAETGKDTRETFIYGGRRRHDPVQCAECRTFKAHLAGVPESALMQ